ncbi:MAG: DUF2238 domain-containing protein [Proteobacteria bacterium]|nr:DUF2238 domain-containing protein [Pseudomonadota bacterium]
MVTKDRIGICLWLLVYGIVLLWSAIEPKDRITWWLEVSPAMIGLVILVWTWQRFRLTTLLYVLILLHCLVLMVGGHYTYAEVPLFNDLKSVFGFERNNYDKLGHFMQGFMPAILAREILIRLQVTKSRPWMVLFVISVCLAFSALYELIEWGVALISDEAAESFLGTQGYVWDTQSDMAWALFGATTALVLLSRWHDAALTKMTVKAEHEVSTDS